MTDSILSPLGKPVAYRDDYDPTLLFPIPRATKRAELGLGDELPFHGVDIWNAYELSWLDARGKPMVAVAEFRIPAESPALIESKSFKLYLNSFAQTRLAGLEQLRERLVRDVSRAAGTPVELRLVRAVEFARESLQELEGASIDALDVAIEDYGPPKPDYLTADPARPVREALVSHLLKSNCPVTGQPDWASVQIRYAGPRIDREGLLRYLVSFRRHSDFHEHCVERIFLDLRARCAPEQLAVCARYTRRGGLDINPYRSCIPDDLAPNRRSARQ